MKFKFDFKLVGLLFGLLGGVVSAGFLVTPVENMTSFFELYVNGVDDSAVVVDRGSSTTISGGRRRRRSRNEYTIVNYGGREGRVPF